MIKAIQGKLNRVTALYRKYFKIKPFRRNALIYSLVFCVCMGVFGVIFSNFSVAVAVSYKGENLGYVTSEAVFSSAVHSALRNVDEKTEKNIDKSLETYDEVVANSQVVTEQTLTNEIVKKVEDISGGYALYRNGTVYAVCEKKDVIENTLEEYLINASSGMDETDFTDDFTVRYGTFAVSDFTDSTGLYEKLTVDAPPVSGVKYITKEESIAFKTVVKKSADYQKGETVIVQEGVKGVRNIVVKQYINGDTVLKSEEVSRTALIDPTPQIVLKGTSAEFKLAFPLPKNSNYNITSSYGEWRGSYAHKGTDIIVDYGTEIFACAGGTVIEAGYSEYGWGNTVLIDHGNGYKTRYAHCSEISVKAGQKVKLGETVGYVGATGDADCNHLHLELYKGSERIDPVPYLNK